MNLQQTLEILQPLHLVVQVSQRGLLALEDLVDGLLLHRVLRLGLNLLEEERDLHDVMDRRHQEVRQLELLAARILVTPLDREYYWEECRVEVSACQDWGQVENNLSDRHPSEWIIFSLGKEKSIKTEGPDCSSNLSPSLTILTD